MVASLIWLMRWRSERYRTLLSMNGVGRRNGGDARRAVSAAGLRGRDATT